MCLLAPVLLGAWRKRESSTSIQQAIQHHAVKEHAVIAPEDANDERFFGWFLLSTYYFFEPFWVRISGRGLDGAQD